MSGLGALCVRLRVPGLSQWLRCVRRSVPGPRLLPPLRVPLRRRHPRLLQRGQLLQAQVLPSDPLWRRSGERRVGEEIIMCESMMKVGCKDNTDCTAGLECQGEGAARQCQDFNECIDPRFKPDAEAFCGPNTNCVNNVGSYSCTCQQGQGLSSESLYVHKTLGYDYWATSAGCAEVDECTDPKYTSGSS